MLTFKAEVVRREQKSDGTFNVKIRLTYQRKVKRLSTSIFVEAKDLTGAFKLKNQRIINEVNELWDGTIAFAAGCPWKAAAFLGQRRWSQTILKITKELLRPCAMMTRRLSAYLPIGMKCQENMVVGL